MQPGDAGLCITCRILQLEEENKVDGPVFNSGRLMGHADMCADLRATIDPEDANHWNRDGLLNEVRDLKNAVAYWKKHAEMFKEDCENIKQEHSKLIEGLTLAITVLF